MRYYIGNTDFEWYQFLKELSSDDINFWQPGGKLRFSAVPIGAPFIFKLKSPINKIVGLGFYVSHSILPIEFVWEVFKERNGVSSLEMLKDKVSSYRNPDNSLEKNPNIGCIILTNPIYFNEDDWLDIPQNWATNIVQGKTYNTEEKSGEELWMNIERLLYEYKFLNVEKESKNQLILEPQEADRYGKEVLTRVRLGQSAFRVLITDVYSRRCSISGERTLPVLEAAHIKPYEKSGPHFISNGLLLRSDIHKLFDKGYLTITNDFKIEVSKKIRAEYENGGEYYKFHGRGLFTLPKRDIDRPGNEFIEWHNNYVYKG